ncbi:MAG TPA: EamA family transporter [Jiangellales bacterium]|nr:EamA family transporter [Jiangellales bacterium]
MPRLLVLLAAICFGTTGTAQALGPAAASPVAVGALRLVVGGALLLGLARLGGHRLTLLRPRAAVLAGAVGVAAYQPLFFAGVRGTGVAVGTLVALGSAPVLTGALAAVLGVRPTRRWAVATVVACAGVACLALGGGPGEVRLGGVLAALGAGASYAVYTLAAKRLLDGLHPADAVMAALFAGGAVLLAPLLLLVDLGWLASPSGVAMALWLGVVPTALAYWLFARGLRRLAAAEVATLTLAEPVTAALLGVAVLGEPVTAGLAAGAVLVVASLAVLTGGPRPARQVVEVPAPRMVDR